MRSPNDAVRQALREGLMKILEHRNVHMRVMSTSPDAIEVSPRRRALNQEVVASLAESIAAVGLLQPILVYQRQDGTVQLIAGRHRLAAAQQLGLECIDVAVVYGDEADCRLSEIAENLHRAELTAQERAEQIAEWVRLTDRQRGLSDNLSGKSPGRPEGGAAAAARDLGMGEREVQRAVKIAEDITPEAKDAARAAGLDDNQSALSKIAAAPGHQQLAVIHNFAEQRQKKSGVQTKRTKESDDGDQALNAASERALFLFGTESAIELATDAIARLDRPGSKDFTVEVVAELSAAVDGVLKSWHEVMLKLLKTTA